MTLFSSRALRGVMLGSLFGPVRFGPVLAALAAGGTVLSVAAAAASTTQQAPWGNTIWVQPLPTPPQPPKKPAPVARGADGYEPAPVPDTDVYTPHAERGPVGPTLTPGLFQPGKTYRGEGFTPGSTAQGDQEKRFRPTPGINLSVPLQ